MEIYNVNTEIFSYNNLNISVEEKSFNHFSEIDDFIELFGEENKIMVIYSISNTINDKLIINKLTDKPIMFFKYKILNKIDGAKIGDYIPSLA